MKIEIVTDGDSRNTKITMNGEELLVSEFNFSIRAGKKAKLQMQRVSKQTHKVEFVSYYADDFIKVDEAMKVAPTDVIGKV